MGTEEQSPTPEGTTASIASESAPSEADFPSLSASQHEQDLPRCYPKCCGRPLYGGNGEALGFVLDAIGRAVSFISAGAFLATALLNLAKEAAGCETEPPEGETTVPECNGRVYGLRPSSLLTTYTLIIGILSSALMPLMGAIVDYTPHRRRVGRISSISFCVLLLPQIFVSEDTWFAVAILQIVVSFIGWAQTMVTMAYLPELTDDKQLLNKWTANFTVVPFLAMVVFLVSVLAAASAFGYDEWEGTDGDVAVARLGQTVALVICCITLSIAWGPLLQPRPASHILPEGQSLWTAGFRQVYHTSIKIWRKYSALKWFYSAVAFSDAAIQSLATVAITYLTDQLEFTSTENGVAILIMLVTSVPGGVAAGWSTDRFPHNPVWSSLISSTILIINTALAAAVLQGPGQQAATYALAGGWGLGTGWKWTSDRFLASTLIPPGQDAELMGYFLFAGQILTWLPPLVFTGLNEAGVSQRIGIASLDIFFVVGFACYALIGNFDDAVKLAQNGSMQEFADVEQTGATLNDSADSIEHGRSGTTETTQIELNRTSGSTQADLGSDHV